jgi:hypothetical protein
MILIRLAHHNHNAAFVALCGRLSGVQRGSARHSFFEADEVVIELANETDEDRLLDVVVALDHRFIGGDDPERVVGVEI